MCIQLQTALNEVLAMPYIQNEHHKSDGAKFAHEDTVADILVNKGFTRYDAIYYPHATKKIFKDFADNGNDTELRNVYKNLPNGSIITQPLGSQSFPDIFVKTFNGNFLLLECKSVKKDKYAPMWNDNVPRPNSIYIFSSGRYNKTTFFLGRDVITPEEYKLFRQIISEVAPIIEKYKLISKGIDKFKRGWVQSSRCQHSQIGGKKFADYFSHPDRQKCEQNVLDYATSQ